MTDKMPAGIHEANKKVSFVHTGPVQDEVQDFIQNNAIKADPKMVEKTKKLMSGRKSPSSFIRPSDPSKLNSKVKKTYDFNFKPDKSVGNCSDESFAQVMKKHRTIPCEEGSKRFEYYFKPEDYIHNINKVMDFERVNNDSACAEKHGFPMPRIPRWLPGSTDLDESFDLHQVISDRLEASETDEKGRVIVAKVNYDEVKVKKLFKNLATGWCSITDFICESDKPTFNYVISLFNKMNTFKQQLTDKKGRKLSRSKTGNGRDNPEDTARGSETPKRHVGKAKNIDVDNLRKNRTTAPAQDFGGANLELDADIDFFHTRSSPKAQKKKKKEEGYTVTTKQVQEEHGLEPMSKMGSAMKLAQKISPTRRRFTHTAMSKTASMVQDNTTQQTVLIKLENSDAKVQLERGASFDAQTPPGVSLTLKRLNTTSSQVQGGNDLKFGSKSKFNTAQRTPVRARNLPLSGTESSLMSGIKKTNTKKEYSTSQFKKLGIYGFADNKTVFDTLFKGKTAAINEGLVRTKTTVKSPRDKSNKANHPFSELDSPQARRQTYTPYLARKPLMITPIVPKFMDFNIPSPTQSPLPEPESTVLQSVNEEKYYPMKNASFTSESLEKIMSSGRSNQKIGEGINIDLQTQEAINPIEIDEEDITPVSILRNKHSQQPTLQHFAKLVTKKSLSTAADTILSKQRTAASTAGAMRITQASPPLQLDWASESMPQQSNSNCVSANPRAPANVKRRRPKSVGILAQLRRQMQQRHELQEAQGQSHAPKLRNTRMANCTSCEGQRPKSNLGVNLEIPNTPTAAAWHINRGSKVPVLPSSFTVTPVKRFVSQKTSLNSQF